MFAESYKNAEILSRFTRDGKRYARLMATCPRCNGRGVLAHETWDGTRLSIERCHVCNGAKHIVTTVQDQPETLVRVREYPGAAIAVSDAAKERERRRYEELHNAELRQRNLEELQRYGFEGPVAYAILGNAYQYREQLKDHGAKFSTELLWVSPTKPTWLKPDRYISVRADDLFALDTLGKVRLRDDAADTRRNLNPTTGKYVGHVGQQLYLTVHVSMVVALRSADAVTYKYILLDSDGNTLVWVTSCSMLAQGGTYTLLATIKDHVTYRNLRNTVLTRCKVVKEGAYGDNT